MRALIAIQEIDSFPVDTFGFLRLQIRTEHFRMVFSVHWPITFIIRLSYMTTPLELLAAQIDEK